MQKAPPARAARLRRRLKWTGAVLGALLAAAPFVIAFTLAGVARRPPTRMFNPSGDRLLPPHPQYAQLLDRFIHDPRTDLGLEFEDVSFPAADGSTLRGWFVPGRSGASTAIVTVHGSHVDRREFLAHVPIFHEMGYPVLLFDCRDHGISDGDGRGFTLGVRESQDVSSAVEFLKQSRGFTRVVAVGASMGASSSIIAAGRDRRIDGVIAEAPFADIEEQVAYTASSFLRFPAWMAALTAKAMAWRIGARSIRGPLEAVAEISPRPILLMHGTDDSTVPFHASQQLFNRAREPKFLWLAPGAGHATKIFKAHPKEYQRRIQSFLSQFFRMH